MLVNDLIARLASPDTTARTEADIQSDVKILLLSGQFGLDEPSLEEQVGDGSRRRIDVAIGATVIEVKKSLANELAAEDHIAQLGGYVRTKTRREQSRYNGILTDGRRWWLFETDPADGEFKRRSIFELSSTDRADNLIEWLQAVLATHSNVKPMQRTIEKFLGSSSPAYEQDISYLHGLYQQVADDPTVRLKRGLWARLLRSALGTGFQNQDQLFFAHTLLVIEAAAIGHAVMGEPLADLAGDPQRLMRGEAFADAGIYNVIESDFFDWVLAAEDGGRFITRLIHRVAVFDWSQTDHDVLKVLYESVIRADTRKSLGEYYTPDWLAEGIVAKVVTDPLKQRVLDPACGSGTFVFHTVRRIIQSAVEHGWDNKRLLDHLQEHVFGLDIHPVSVLLARITYLLALGDRLQDDRDEIWVPIHLGDSVQWHQPPDHDEDAIRIRTEGIDLALGSEESTLFELANTLIFPLASIDDPGTFDRLVTAMTSAAKRHIDNAKKRPSVKPILTQFGIPDGHDAGILTETFNLLCDLNAQGRDSIWGYFVRNQVRPVWLSMSGRRVDVLVGNPPWVAYRFMTPEMQAKFKAMSEKRNLWHGAKVATHQDLVGLFIVRAAEKYLSDSGTFGFVTPLAVLSRQHYEGFRAGKWGPQLRGELTELWDLDAVRPNGFFPVPAGVVFGTRHSSSIDFEAEDVPYGSPATKTVLTGLRNIDGWAATSAALTFTTVPNRAITAEIEGGSPYRSNVTQGAVITPRCLFFVVEEQVTNKLGQTAGRTTVRSLRTAQEDKRWKPVPDVTGVVENRFIFDVHLGSTIAPFRPLATWRAVLPIEKEALIRRDRIADHATGLGHWWTTTSALWEVNKTAQSKLSLAESLNYQSKLSKQLGGTKHRVVYSKAGTRMAAARLDNSKQVIDHTLYWLPARGIDEARYIVAVLNAPALTEAVTEYQSRGLFGARHFDTYVWRLPIPRFDQNDPLHRQIVDLSIQAEELAAGVDLEGFGFQKARGLIRAGLDAAGISDQLDVAVRKLLDGEGESTTV
ncbi:N-6 DNA methylase [Prescottella sp. D32]|uniref:N-6 DNA methylase n=1 Tax=Prescottella sp. D32 TaxID=3029740 RepID=UPI003078FB4D